MDIKPIQTKYKGYNFRSRLEARWAILFEKLGWTWQYEPEGYVLSNGVHYLPDFYLPEIETFVEVKANELTIEEKKKCELLCLGTSKFVMMAIGPPAKISYEAFVRCGQYETDIADITLTSYIRSKGWIMPYIGGFWSEEDQAAFNAALSARFEHGETPG